VTASNWRDAPVPEIVAAARGGDRRAIGRLLTLVERGGAAADEVTALTHPTSGAAHVVGMTGAPGAGKSTLTGQLVAAVAAAGGRPAVLAVDPSSPLTGGAILGDRIRMDDVAHPGAFIRSMATRGHHGGLALAVPGAVRVFDAAGFDPILIETVGVGQVEVDIARAADTTVVVVTPGWGDAVQANKAGLLEVADVFVVNKADRPGANDARRDLELMLDLSHITGQDRRQGHRPEIVMTTATKGDGAAEVWAAIVRHRQHLTETGRLAARREARLRREVRDHLERALLAAADQALDVPAAASALAEVHAHRRAPTEVATAVLAKLLR
jgi:LAO/AO transport system kinase